MIKRKIAAKGGFTMTELLVTAMIVSILGIAVAVGISVAARAFSEITMSSEAAVLSGTLATELADELRFAENIEGAGTTFTFTSRRFGSGASILNTDGRVTVGGRQILPDIAYTGLSAAAEVDYNGSFDVTITITNAGGSTAGTASFSVAPLSG